MQELKNKPSEFYSSIKSNVPLIMGILNTTPDSFSDGGKYNSVNSAVIRALEMLELGADIIDIGGESSRPGADPVNFEEEYRRVIPVIESILDKKPDTVISVDTTIAEAALICGTSIINDISGLTFDPDIIDVIKKYDATAVIMHMRGTPQTMQTNTEYKDVTSEVYDFLISQAKKSGIKKIIIDPGIGFGKKVNHNYELIKNLNKFTGSGYPVLIGLSRKSFIGKSLNLQVNQRDNATVIAEALSLINGADIIRTHNVKNAIELKRIYQLIQNPDLAVNV